MRKRGFENLRENQNGKIEKCFRCKTPTNTIADWKEEEFDYDDNKWYHSDFETNPMCSHCFNKSQERSE